MEKQTVDEELRRFAENRLNAQAYADCTHTFSLWNCEKCGGISFVVAVERHVTDVPGDFHGILRATCAGCGHAAERLSVVTKGAAQVKAIEHPTCGCGGDAFHVGMCERWGEWGFFDEGTVVAMCAACGSKQAFVDTD